MLKKAGLAVLVPKLGPYHAAQLSALAAGLRLRVGVVEFDYGQSGNIYDRVRARGLERFDAGRGSGGFFGHQARLFKAFELFRPDWVFVPGWHEPAALLAYRWCEKRDVPLIVRSPSVSWDSKRAAFKEGLKRRLLLNADAALVGGTPQRRYLADLGVDPSLIFDSCDVVDNAYFARGAEKARLAAPAAGAALGLPPSYFLYCGRLEAEKNLDGLIRAYALYRKRMRRPSWGLVLVGDGKAGPSLRALCQELGLGTSVFFAGRKSYAELPGYYGWASAFVLPSLREPWGLVVNEAAAAGLPLLVSRDCGCCEDLVRDGVNGYSFDPRDTAALAERMVQFSTRRSRSVRMGRAAQDGIAQWDLKRFVEGMRGALALKRRPGKAPFASRLAHATAFLRYHRVI